MKANGVEKPQEGGNMKRLSIMDWYRVLRVRHHLTMFQAIRYALWLTR